MTDYRLGAERVQLVSRPLGNASVGRGGALRLPVGRVHATGADGAVCGRPGELHDFGPWRLGGYPYCKECRALVPLSAESP